MIRRAILALALSGVLSVTTAAFFLPAIPVVDPLTIATTVGIAALKQEIVSLVTKQEARILKMATRLSAIADLKRYVPAGLPPWLTTPVESTLPGTVAFMDALNQGVADPDGVLAAGYDRYDPTAALARLDPARAAVLRIGLADLDARDSLILTSTDQTGRIRGNGLAEREALTQLEYHVGGGPDLPSSPRSGSDIVRQVRGSHTWDFSSKQGLCAYSEAVVTALHAADANFGHLQKLPGQNHCVDANGHRHAVDVALYRDTGQIVDFIGSAGFGNPPPENPVTWQTGPNGEYSEANWYAPGGSPTSTPSTSGGALAGLMRDTVGGTNAILGTLTGASLLRARQQESRLQMTTAILEHVTLENKRRRDLEVAVMNSRLTPQPNEEDGGLLTGSAHVLRDWRQP